MAISFWKYTEYTLPVPKQKNRAFCGGAQGVYLFFSKKDSLLVFCFTKKHLLRGILDDIRDFYTL